MIRKTVTIIINNSDIKIEVIVDCKEDSTIEELQQLALTKFTESFAKWLVEAGKEIKE